jgi:hypothetical protein
MGQVARAPDTKNVLPGADESEIGLSSAAAEQRFAEFGPNEPVPAKITGRFFNSFASAPTHLS